MLPLLLLALAQAPDAGSPVPPEVPEANRTPEDAPVAESRLGSDRPRIEPASDPRPAMRPDLPVYCGFLEPTREVPSGYHRVQCDEQARRCLVSSTKALDASGVEGREPLARANDCIALSTEDFAAKAREGYRFVPAIADAPPGWVRDERGRVMQVNFDLNRRVYLGAAYAPRQLRGAGEPSGRVRADFGIEVELPGDEPILYRVHVLESELHLGVDTTIDATLLRYDWSIAREAPVLWITTFVGKPRRFDLSFDLGGWFEAIHLESVKRGTSAANNFLTLGAANLTIDLWHSRDLVSYMRLRFGPALELDNARQITAAKPMAALEGDLTLDGDGFHPARFQAAAEKLLFDPVVEGRPQNPQRLELRAGYELILIAINDYPLSATLDGRAAWRDDLPFETPGWDIGVEAGLRFSFWAPARRSAAAQPSR